MAKRRGCSCLVQLPIIAAIIANATTVQIEITNFEYSACRYYNGTHNKTRFSLNCTATCGTISFQVGNSLDLENLVKTDYCLPSMMSTSAIPCTGQSSDCTSIMRVANLEVVTPLIDLQIICQTYEMDDTSNSADSTQLVISTSCYQPSQSPVETQPTSSSLPMLTSSIEPTVTLTTDQISSVLTTTPSPLPTTSLMSLNTPSPSLISPPPSSSPVFTPPSLSSSLSSTMMQSSTSSVKLTITPTVIVDSLPIPVIAGVSTSAVILLVAVVLLVGVVLTVVIKRVLKSKTEHLRE